MSEDLFFFAVDLNNYVPASLYLLHQVHLYSHLLSSSPATAYPAFSQVNLSWVMKPNLLLSVGTLLLNPFPMLFFLLKAGGIFSFFQSLPLRTTQVLLTFLTSFPPHCSHCSLPDHHSPASPPLCLLKRTSVICSQLPWFRVDLGISDFFLMNALHSPVLWDIESCSLLGMWLQQGHTVLPSSALLFGCRTGLPPPRPPAAITKRMSKFKRSGANLLSYPLSNL